MVAAEAQATSKEFLLLLQVLKPGFPREEQGSPGGWLESFRPTAGLLKGKRE